MRQPSISLSLDIYHADYRKHILSIKEVDYDPVSLVQIYKKITAYITRSHDFVLMNS